jgi:hypothetical protein
MRWREIALTAPVVLAACSIPAGDKQSDGVARAFYAEVRSNADLSRDPHVDPALATPAAAAELAAVRAWAPGEAPKQVNNTGWSYNSSLGQVAVAQLSHAYVYAGDTVHVQSVLHKLPGQMTWTIVGFEANAEHGPAVTVGVQPKGAGDEPSPPGGD